MAFRGYAQFCPVAKASQVLTERWTPLVVRELLSGSHRFNELRRGVPLISPALLSERLRQLQDAGVVERRRPEKGSHWEYHLTPAGEELREVIERLGVWGQRWARSAEREPDLDVALLMWDLRRRVRLERLPSQRVVVQFDFSDAPPKQAQWWLVLDHEADVCLIHPGFAVDVRVATDVETMTRIWLGDLSFASALGSGALWMGGPPDLRRALPEWLALSVFADVDRPARSQRPGGPTPG